MSRAVARDRRIPLGAYYTPPALAAALVADAADMLRGRRVLEPGVGGGSFARPLSRLPDVHVIGCDLNPAAVGFADSHAGIVGSVLDLDLEALGVSAVVGNPDYGIAQEVAEHALTAGSVEHVFMLLRLAFLESQKRIPFWTRWPPRRVSVLSSRAHFTADGGSDSAAYAWFHWDRSGLETRLTWIHSPDGRRWAHPPDAEPAPEPAEPRSLFTP